MKMEDIMKILAHAAKYVMSHEDDSEDLQRTALRLLIAAWREVLYTSLPGATSC